MADPAGRTMMDVLGRLERAVMALARSRSERVNVAISLRDAALGATTIGGQAGALRNILRQRAGGRATGAIRTGMHAYNASLTEMGRLKAQMWKNSIRMAQTRSRIAVARATGVSATSPYIQRQRARMVNLQRRRGRIGNQMAQQRQAGQQAIGGAMAAANRIGGGVTRSIARITAGMLALGRVISVVGAGFAVARAAMSVGAQDIEHYGQLSPGGIQASLVRSVGQFHRNLHMSKAIQEDMLEYARSEKRFWDHMLPAQEWIHGTWTRFISNTQNWISGWIERFKGTPPPAIGGGLGFPNPFGEAAAKNVRDIEAAREQVEIEQARLDEARGKAGNLPPGHPLSQAVQRAEINVRLRKKHLEDMLEKQRQLEQQAGPMGIPGLGRDWWLNQNLPNFGASPDAAAIEMARNFGRPGPRWSTIEQLQALGLGPGQVPMPPAPPGAGGPPRILTEGDKQAFGAQLTEKIQKINDQWNALQQELDRFRPGSPNYVAPGRALTPEELLEKEQMIVYGDRLERARQEMMRQRAALSQATPGQVVPWWLDPFLQPPPVPLP